MLSETRLVSLVGVHDLLVVDTPDALLVAHRDKAQDVRKVFNRLRADGHEAAKLHRTAHRPWGTYTVLEEGDGFKIKRIEVKPGAALSLQMHEHRSEHWVVVSGEARVTRDDEVFLLPANQSTFIPLRTRHRLENPGSEPLAIIEGLIGYRARAIGGASLPLLAKFMRDRELLFRDPGDPRGTAVPEAADDLPSSN